MSRFTDVMIEQERLKETPIEYDKLFGYKIKPIYIEYAWYCEELGILAISFNEPVTFHFDLYGISLEEDYSSEFFRRCCEHSFFNETHNWILLGEL